MVAARSGPGAPTLLAPRLVGGATVELNADFSLRAVVHAGRLPWVPSPVPGVERRMLDRIGDEVARATSIVRYAPGSRFSPHTHGGGEEFFVLDGIFQDETSDFPAGSYVRNPPTSRHVPGSASGCVIFVKLWQFDPDDRVAIRLDTRKMPFATAAGREGIEIMPLYRDASEKVRLERWAPGAVIDVATPGGAELLVMAPLRRTETGSSRNPGFACRPAGGFRQRPVQTVAGSGSRPATCCGSAA